MKKLFLYVFLASIFYSNVFAEEIDCNTLNECLKKNYIIKSKMTFKPHDTIFNIIYELVKKREKVLIHCIVKYRLSSGTTRLKGSRCYKP